MGYIKKFNGSVDKAIQLGGEGNAKSIEGYFLGSKDTQSDYGPGKLHVFQTKDGTVGVWGKTRMNNALTEDLKGQMVRVTFTGMIQPSKKGRRPSYGYDVEHDPENIMDVTGVSLSTTTSEADEEEGDDNDWNGEDTSTEEYEAPAAPVRKTTTSSAASVQALLNKGRTSKNI